MSETKSPIRGFKTLLIGPMGTGKTSAIRTLIPLGITPMCLFTEPRYGVLGDTDSTKLHWHYIEPLTEELDMLQDKIQKMATLTHEMQTKAIDSNRHKDNKHLELVKQLNCFVCQRTGEEFGRVKDFGTNKALIIDSTSGWGKAVRGFIAGSRPALNEGDYGKMQDALEDVINWCTTGLRCHVILIGHVEESAMTGTIGISLPGKKLARKIGTFFDDVVLACRKGSEFTWSTAEANADLKATYLPVASGQKPNFATIIENWKKKGGIIE